MRGTLHFVSSADVRWMLGLLPERSIPRYQKGRGLNEAALKRGEEVIAKALSVNVQMTRGEIYHIFDTIGMPALRNPDVQRHIIRRAGRDGLICFGSHNGKQPTFALLDDWVPKSKMLKGKEALAELAKRYFVGHGPATLKDFVWWSGLKVSDARIGAEMASSQLAKETFDGATYWMPLEIKELHDSSPTAYLLPAFDEYLIGYRDRRASLKDKHSQRVVPGGNGMFLPVIIIDGNVVGTWRRVLDKDNVDILLNPLTKLSRAHLDSIEVAAERYGKFMDKHVLLRND